MYKRQVPISDGLLVIGVRRCARAAGSTTATVCVLVEVLEAPGQAWSDDQFPDSMFTGTSYYSSCPRELLVSVPCCISVMTVQRLVRAFGLDRRNQACRAPTSWQTTRQWKRHVTSSLADCLLDLRCAVQRTQPEAHRTTCGRCAGICTTRTSPDSYPDEQNIALIAL